MRKSLYGNAYMYGNVTPGVVFSYLVEYETLTFLKVQNNGPALAGVLSRQCYQVLPNYQSDYLSQSHFYDHDEESTLQ